MSKIEKKRKKLIERVLSLEKEMREELKKKTSSTAEISISDYQRKIYDIRRQLESPTLQN